MLDGEVKVIAKNDFYFSFDGLGIVIGKKMNGRIHILRIDGEGYARWDRQEDDTATVPGHTFILPSEVLLPLLDALTSHYKGASDVRDLREFLAHESRRRDSAEDALRQIALAGATGNLANLLGSVRPRTTPVSQEDAKAQDHL
jgi:hypothetical protein